MAQCEISVLGTLAVSVDGRRLDKVGGPTAAAVLTVLALAGRRGCAAYKLLDSVRHPDTNAPQISSQNALQQHLSGLRRLGIPVAGYGELHSSGYALEWDRVRVDAAEFIEAVDALPETPAPGQLTTLLSMWREDPRSLHTRVAAGCWSRVLQARRTLLDKIERSVPGAVPGLAEFADLFPADPDLAAVRALLQRSERKRLLVVEDQNLDLIVETLRSDYECVPIADLTSWHRYLRGCNDRPDVHGALIDLHLTPALNDMQGLDIAEWLRDHTEIPTALMTMAPPPGDLTERVSTHRRRYRLAKIIYKGRDGLDLSGIREAAACLTGHAEHHVRTRLETWLEHVAFSTEERLDRYPRTRQVARQRDEFEQDAERARRAMAREPLATARRAVEEFRAKWDDSGR